MDLFDYCEKRTTYQEHQDCYRVNYTQLPPKMMRMTQSQTFFAKRLNAYQLKEERTSVINRRVETVEKYFERHYQYPEPNELGYKTFNGYKKDAKCKYNGAARKYLKKLWEETTNYIAKTPVGEINNDLREFDLSGLEIRLKV